MYKDCEWWGGAHAPLNTSLQIHGAYSTIIPPTDSSVIESRTFSRNRIINKMLLGEHP